MHTYNELLYNSFDGNSILRIGNSEELFHVVLNIISYKKLLRDELNPFKYAGL